MPIRYTILSLIFSNVTIKHYLGHYTHILMINDRPIALVAFNIRTSWLMKCYNNPFEYALAKKETPQLCFSLNRCRNHSLQLSIDVVNISV